MNGDLIQVEDVWVPLVVSVGPVGITAAGISKIAKSVITPLADFGVSVYCLSTYKTDYVLVSSYPTSFPPLLISTFSLLVFAFAAAFLSGVHK